MPVNLRITWHVEGPTPPLVPLQVIELAAAVHRLNQDKCQLENQMEMEEVPPAVQASCHDDLPCMQTITPMASCILHTVPLIASTILYICCACRRRWSTGCSANLKDF